MRWTVRTPATVAAARRVLWCVFLAATVAGCAKEGEVAYRGANLEVAPLALNDMVFVYRAALGGPFTLGDPSLSILVDTLFLPRGRGLSGGTALPAELIAALRGAGVIKGTCAVPVSKSRQPLVCRAAMAGYAVRVSEPFALGADSVQVHVVVEQYAIPGGPRAERLRFERAYHVVRQGGGWRAVREARLPQP